MCPLLLHLDLRASIDIHISEPAISAAICEFRNLRTFAINTGLSKSALMHLGQMKNLTTLEACWNPLSPSLTASLCWWPGELPRRSLFPTLEKLSFSAYSLSTCNALLRSIQSQALESLSFLVGTLLDISDFFQLINSEAHLFQSVKHISIRTLPQMGVHGGSMFSRITGVALAPLLTLTNLTFVDINVGQCSFDLNDEILLLMATSWPFLQTLYLGHIQGWGDLSSITLDGLVPLVAHCSHLQNLGIVVNAGLDPVPYNNGPINDKITHLHLGDSSILPIPYSYPTHIAEFLSGLFPKLTKIYTCGKPQNVLETWSRVEEMVVMLGTFGEITGSEDI